jgi:hypothetical protein
MLGRSLRSRLDILKPDLQQTIKVKQEDMILRRKTSMRTFTEGQSVLARNYTSAGPKWLTGVIIKQTGPVSYQVRVKQMIWRRHTDQLRETGLVANDVARSNVTEAAQPVITPTTPYVQETQSSSQQSGRTKCCIKSSCYHKHASRTSTRCYNS